MHLDSRSRRRVLASLAALPLLANAQARPALLTRAIPSSGELLPVVGLGSWITFNVGRDPAARADCLDVMRQFFANGGRLIDSSPMYGSAQDVIGEAVSRLKPAQLFSADKVWIGSSEQGPAQVEASRKLWRAPRFDLLQVHNLLAWEAHLPLLLRMKREGRLRYVGITTSEGRRHADILKIMGSQPVDFVQVSYNVLDREVEQRILPLARERRIGVIVNRPFRQGELTQALAGKRLPGWAADIGCTSWAQVLLKFIVAHPAVTCAIPATSSVAHVRENMLAARGPLPDEALRRRIVQDVERLA
ncbi:aldo/keto reductase [Telluria aromaticivorans]|uniref:Aldo/keto reductase n=1 Tax=Telluria aromaticivorans TaxID=2725995 RepID=A0A7Y2K1X6_9BURK|nr:aldo/keto reductase [Telluria aromaticivorans]NNG25132.1 aldo/keto reductase [Telluria aromaticivorans]